MSCIASSSQRFVLTPELREGYLGGRQRRRSVARVRRFYATWHHHGRSFALDRTPPLFPGETRGRLRPATIQRRVAQLDAPASLWHDPPDTTIGDGANADGRALVPSLSAWRLWVERGETKS